ncbi:DoxX family membrane protein [bacterium AH-315-J21]|nr:DoxX family membrane protein [bacterium AH-315-J21]
MNKKPTQLPTAALITALIRLTLGPLFIVYGWSKLSRLNDTVDMLRSGFADTWLPLGLVTAVAYLIPFWEALIGLSLLLGLYYRWGLVATGVLLSVLTFGLAVQGDYELISRNLIYLIFVFFGLKYSGDCHWSLDRAFSKTRSEGSQN